LLDALYGAFVIVAVLAIYRSIPRSLQLRPAT
jgi:hypothetical protein